MSISPTRLSNRGLPAVPNIQWTLLLDYSIRHPKHWKLKLDSGFRRNDSIIKLASMGLGGDSHSSWVPARGKGG
jgi:hypothetical protein